MQISLMPKEYKFFDLFNKQSHNMYTAAKLFNELVTTGNFNEDTVAKMHKLEQEGDILTHEITDTLNRTFITPFDREDIFTLANHIDNIIDAIDGITKRMGLYKLTTPDAYMKQFSVIIEQSCHALHEAVNCLKNTKHRTRICDYCLEVGRLENAADQVRSMAIGDLFDKTTDAIQVIKWKEMYETAEYAVDTCEHTAKAIQSILVKQA
jgi:predicted phosphate transport protein (TIGR00153 family)